MSITIPRKPSEELDIEWLRAKYAQERDRRRDPRKSEQYIAVRDDYAHLDDDPWAGDAVARDPLDEAVEAVVIGGGFGGLVTAVELKRAGIEDVRIVEKAADFGGTWYWNRYPGAQCDIESYVYMPLLEETGYLPTEKYAHAEEIFEHARRIGRHFGLYERALFQTQVEDMAWHEDIRRWTLTTDRGDRIQARYVFSASGPLHRPKLPGIPGIERFAGHMFHTSRWDYSYTGGDRNGGLEGLKDKNVALIGTAATAVQCVPYLAKDAKRLYVVQRTPSTVGVRGNKPTEPAWSASLQRGWQRKRIDNFNAWVCGITDGEDLVHDGWTVLFHDLLTAGLPQDGQPLTPEESMWLAEQMDFRKGEEARARVQAIVQKPEVAESLKAWYGFLCKRPTYSDSYLPAFNRDNVTLVDTRGRGLDEITEDAIVSNGVAYPVDCIVFATGFEVGTDYSRRTGCTIRGVGGRTLAQHFEQGARSLHGYHVHGFPNLFLLGVGQGAIKRNFTDMLSEQAEHLVSIVADARRAGATRIEATAEAEAAWLRTLSDKSLGIRTVLAQCTPGYFNGEGDVERSVVANTYGGGPIEFTQLLRDWRARGDHAGLRME